MVVYLKGWLNSRPGVFSNPDKFVDSSGHRFQRLALALGLAYMLEEQGPWLIRALLRGLGKKQELKEFDW